MKHDGDVYNALPPGREKDLWAASVEAQGERLRLYRENISIGEQAVAWYAFFALAINIVGFFTQAALGWPTFQLLTVADIPLIIPFTFLFVVNLVFAVFVTVRLVLGYSTSFRADGKGHYPKFIALRGAERKRLAKRSMIERRVNVVQYKADQERKEAKRRARSTAADTGK